MKLWCGLKLVSLTGSTWHDGGRWEAVIVRPWAWLGDNCITFITERGCTQLISIHVTELWIKLVFDNLFRFILYSYVCQRLLWFEWMEISIFFSFNFQLCIVSCYDLVVPSFVIQEDRAPMTQWCYSLQNILYEVYQWHHAIKCISTVCVSLNCKHRYSMQWINLLQKMHFHTSD